jgi:hypothetical protein
LLKALKRAQRFINNGVKYGYIIEPDEPDQACETIRIVDKTISKIKE